MYGESSFQVIKLFGNSVQTNVEAILIMAATAFAANTWEHGALIVTSFAVGTGLHLACHWLVAIAFGKGIDRMVLTRAGRIDYSGASPTFGEALLRTLAGPTTNAVCAGAAYALLASGVDGWPPIALLALSTFAACNLVLTAINFLPAIPFDGGLVLQLVMSRVFDEGRGLKIAVWTSMALLLGMAGLGAWLAQPVLLYLALTIGYDNWRKHLRGAPAS